MTITKSDTGPAFNPTETISVLQNRYLATNEDLLEDNLHSQPKEGATGPTQAEPQTSSQQHQQRCDKWSNLNLWRLLLLLLLLATLLSLTCSRDNKPVGRLSRMVLDLAWLKACRGFTREIRDTPHHGWYPGWGHQADGVNNGPFFTMMMNDFREWKVVGWSFAWWKNCSKLCVIRQFFYIFQQLVCNLDCYIVQDFSDLRIAHIFGTLRIWSYYH